MIRAPLGTQAYWDKWTEYGRSSTEETGSVGFSDVSKFELVCPVQMEKSVIVEPVTVNFQSGNPFGCRFCICTRRRNSD